MPDLQKQLFALLEKGIPGYTPFTDKTEKLLVEWNRCPDCRRRLEYRGLLSVEASRAFGVCKPCEYAKEFIYPGSVVVKI